MNNVPVTIDSPLAQHVLHQAGVPLEDSLWFARQEMSMQMKCLSTPRGGRILNQVRKYLAQINANNVAPMGV